MLRSLVGSEMCIRDSEYTARPGGSAPDAFSLARRNIVTSRWKYYPPDWITESSYQRVGRPGRGTTPQGGILEGQWGDYRVLYGRVTPGERIPWRLGAGGSAGSSTYDFSGGPISVYVPAGRPGGIDIAPVTEEEPTAWLEGVEDVDLYGEITPQAFVRVFSDEGNIPSPLRSCLLYTSPSPRDS